MLCWVIWAGESRQNAQPSICYKKNNVFELFLKRRVQITQPRRTVDYCCSSKKLPRPLYMFFKALFLWSTVYCILGHSTTYLLATYHAFQINFSKSFRHNHRGLQKSENEHDHFRQCKRPQKPPYCARHFCWCFGDCGLRRWRGALSRKCRLSSHSPLAVRIR